MRLQLFAITLVAGVACSLAFAGDRGYEGRYVGHGKGGRRVFCPHCGDACYPTVTKGKETKHCWEVDTKAICIPKVRFPWESTCGKGCGGEECGKSDCAPPQCRRTKYVNVLLKHEYECSVCKYIWDVDSYKHDDSTSNTAPHVGEPSSDGPTVAEPPPVEASLPQSNRRVAPVAFDQAGPIVPATKSYAEILTSFFR